MESATASVRGAGAAPLARARPPPPLVCGVAAARGPRRVVGAGGLAAAHGRRRRRALVAVASLQDPLPSRVKEVPVAVAPQADGEDVGHGNGSAGGETSSPPVGETVRVRFVLVKHCASGQSVHLVGDDPALGLWDPANAIPMEWADSQDWILEKDLPANKLIEFKFLLRDSSGKLHWQNGPNRIFQTGEATNRLVVYEDWNDVKKQKIEEEEIPYVGLEEPVVSDDGESRKDAVLEDKLPMDDTEEVKEDESVVAEEDEKSVVATNASVQVETLKTNEANPQESMLQKEPETIDELRETVGVEKGSALCPDENSAEKTEGDNILSEDGVPVENGLTSAYEHDLLWGWKALQQLLMNLGFKMDTT
nr:unnamed protein product [Digitaria exilis]